MTAAPLDRPSHRANYSALAAQQVALRLPLTICQKSCASQARGFGVEETS